MKLNHIRKVYLIHHSHTDIGYTDMQEQVIYNHVNNIRQAVKLIRYGIEHQTPEKDFVWNCETLFCVEEFLRHADDAERQNFFDLVKRGNIGLSGSYLNFTDLADCEALSRRTQAMQEVCKAYGTEMHSAMNADINGISLGARNVLLDNGISFLYTNIHAHHGMYPLYKNQLLYRWEAEDGRQLMVLSGEHYNIGNVVGLNSNTNVSFHPNLPQYRSDAENESFLENLHVNLIHRLAAYEKNSYPYDFAVMSISGVFSDNAPPNPALIYNVEAFNARYGDEVRLEMLTLDRLYEKIHGYFADVPAYRGDLTDWWAHGVGSTPYAVKHYKEAQRLEKTCDRLEEHTGVRNEKLAAEADRNLLLYAEHTWGHSSTISNPYDTMVFNLDIRKNSYASKAHEAGTLRKIEQFHLLGDRHSYYNAAHGLVKAVNVSWTAGLKAVEFYVETGSLNRVRIVDQKTGKELPNQVSGHPRGRLISFLSYFEAGECREFTYEALPDEKRYMNEWFFYGSVPYVGQEQVRDIVNTEEDPESYQLPYGIENDWFRISWKVGEGITSFYDKKSEKELLCAGTGTFFTPLYENTAIRTNLNEERRLCGRNIRGQHAELFQGDLTGVRVLTRGPVFISMELQFALEGTCHSSVILKLFRNLPKLTFTYQIGKTISSDIESIFLPIALNLPDAERYLVKGGVPMRPGIDQLPGTCQEYYISDCGVLYQDQDTSYFVNTLDVPLVYQGEMQHHPIQLCTNNPENNRRPLYSWIMNNIWETNFKMDLSGFSEFCYTFERAEKEDKETALRHLTENDLPLVTFIADTPEL